MLRDPYLLAATLAALAGAAFWSEGRFAWGRRVGATLLGLVALGG